MKILQMNLKKGIAKVLPESLDDLWHLYNVILEKDEVHARTTREVKVEDQYARPKRGKRVPVLLGVKVEKMFWDKILNRLRIHGIVCEAPEKISIKGSHHTIDVTVNKPITIVKTEWLKHQIDRLKRASRVTAAPLIIMSIDDEEYCVAVLRQYGVDVKAEEKTRLPGKLEAEKRTGAMREFFKMALKFLREVWISLRSPIVIIGPGFVKNDFAKYVKREALDVADAVIDVKGVNSAGVAGIHEALRSGVFTKALKHVRIAEETKVMEEVLARLGKGRGDITYGFAEVEKASAYGAVEKLLVADATLRETPDEKRKALEKIMKEVEEKGGQIMVISTEHEAGTELLSLGGVAALLRFPLG
ncbi:MAG: mRNA surveillance protein pelota [Candidatus Bathyarchaeota archaeon]|nr:mRNA surveillance protein pelota [Candidatus Bathyarchaeota archaeon]